MPPKKKDELKQIVPVYNAEKPAPLFWKYEKYSLEDRQLFDAFFLNFQKELQIKMTDNIYTNIDFLCQSIGSKIHPLFKQVSQDEQMEAKTLKQIEIDDPKKQQEVVDISKTSKNGKSQVQPQPDPKNQKKDDQKANPAATAGKEDPKKGIKKDDNAQSKEQKKATEIELIESEEEIKQEMLPYLLISSQRIDYLTMKMILFQIPFTNINTFKLHNNMLDDETLELLISFFNSEVSQKIKKVFFEWNSLISSEKRSLFFQTLAKSINIDNLILRGNSLQDEMTSVISQQLIPSSTATTSSNIKFLDLYDNQIGIEGFQSLGKMIYKNKNLTTLGLCKNGISSVSQIEQILISIGKYPMSEEQYQAYRNSEKERDQIIERNKKLKGKKLLEAEPVPELEAIEQITENKWAITRNNSLNMLNLSLNQLSDESVERFENFLQVVHDNFQIILSFNNFDQKSKERLKKRFNKKIGL